MNKEIEAPQQSSVQVNGYRVYLENLPMGQDPKCAFLGPEGTYTQQAASQLLDKQAEFTPIPRITEVLRGIDLGKYELGVVPIENSSEGNVVETIREIVRSNLNILGEYVLPIHHVMFGSPAAKEKKIVRSHPQAIGQCSIWIEQNLPGAEVVTHNSTSDAIKVAAERDELAIGNLTAASIYEIPILAENINDLKGNTTRFWLVGKGESEPTGNDRTTILFSLKNRQGLLRDALGVFADRGVNITKIDSFPIGALDEYYFLLSLDGHTEDSLIKKTMEEFKEVCLKVRIIGSYGKAEIPEKYFEPDAILNGWLAP